MISLKTCYKCGFSKKLNNDNFHKSSRNLDGFSGICKSCKSKNSKHRLRLNRIEALKKVSGRTEPKCECCGENNIEFLAIDHIYGGGSKRRSIDVKERNINTYVLNNDTRDLRVLCHNCNCSLGFYGYCPHTKEKIIFLQEIEKKYPRSELYCKRGHKKYGDKLYISSGKRYCYKCKLSKNREFKRKNKINKECSTNKF